MFHKRFIVELSFEEQTCLKQLIATSAPQTLAHWWAQIWLLCGEAGLDR